MGNIHGNRWRLSTRQHRSPSTYPRCRGKHEPNQRWRTAQLATPQHLAAAPIPACTLLHTLAVHQSNPQASTDAQDCSAWAAPPSQSAAVPSVPAVLQARNKKRKSMPCRSGACTPQATQPELRPVGVLGRTRLTILVHQVVVMSTTKVAIGLTCAAVAAGAVWWWNARKVRSPVAQRAAVAQLCVAPGSSVLGWLRWCH